MNAPTWAGFVFGPWLPEACAVVGRREGSRGRGVWVEDAPFQAARLQRLLRAGRWAHQPPHRVSVPKPRGGARVLSVFHPTEQALHRALSACLSTWLEGCLSDASMAFRPRRSVRMAVARADQSLRAGRGVAAEMDVLSCFDEVRHDLTLDALRSFGLADPQLLELIEHCMRVGARWGRVGLAQGSALSPVLLNAHLHEVDQAMARRPGYLRYADDLLCLCESEEEAVEAFSELRAALASRAHRLHPGKSRVISVGDGWTWLGASVADGRLRVPHKPSLQPPGPPRPPARSPPGPSAEPAPSGQGGFRAMVARLLGN